MKPTKKSKIQEDSTMAAKIKRKKTTKCFIHCENRVEIVSSKDCSCEDHFECLIVYCEEEPIVKLLKSGKYKYNKKKDFKDSDKLPL